jgi:hypothetical protein
VGLRFSTARVEEKQETALPQVSLDYPPIAQPPRFRYTDAGCRTPLYSSRERTGGLVAGVRQALARRSFAIAPRRSCLGSNVPAKPFRRNERVLKLSSRFVRCCVLEGYSGRFSSARVATYAGFRSSSLRYCRTMRPASQCGLRSVGCVRVRRRSGLRLPLSDQSAARAEPERNSSRPARKTRVLRRLILFCSKYPQALGVFTRACATPRRRANFSPKAREVKCLQTES